MYIAVFLIRQPSVQLLKKDYQSKALDFEVRKETLHAGCWQVLNMWC